MKISRRQALWGAFGLGVGISGFWGIRKLYQVYATPNLAELESGKAELKALVEAIIPSQLNNPGANETNTAEFVLYALRECTEAKAQNNFISGLNEISNRAKRRFSKTLPECSLEQRVELLTLTEEESESVHVWAKKAKRKLLGDEFIFTLKRLTIWGYCTSELGATTGLSYDYIPAKFNGDVLLFPGQKSWATS
jgi:hypothetical protein